MAIMAPDIQIVKRSDGRSSVAFAAYRAAVILMDERTGESFDYTRKSGVIHSEILAPLDVPSWVNDRQQLWANVELASRRKDAQVAREFMLPLPHELSADQRIALVREFVTSVLVSQGMIADIAIHLPDRRGDQRNHHAHITCTMRHISSDGFGKQAREWNDDFAALKKLYALKMTGQTEEAEKLEHELRKTRPIFDWREQWAATINKKLAESGHDIRVDHRSWEDQGIEREAEPHMGVDATQMERKGETSELGDERREVQERNALREQIAEEINVIELDQERQKRSARDAHLAATAFDHTRESIKQLRLFDKGHAAINFYEREISKAYAKVRRHEGRARYARSLVAQVGKNMEIAFGDKGAAATVRFWADVNKIGIHRANRLLLEKPRRYGSLPGWQIGRRIFFSEKRRDANRLLLQTAEIARQGFYMHRKLQRTEEVERRQLEDRIAALKAEQAKAMQAPPEGRLIIQCSIFRTARYISRADWMKLSRAERYHVTQARQLMKYADLRTWAESRAKALIAEAAGVIPINVSPLIAAVDLKEISPLYHKAELDSLWREMKLRQEEEDKALTVAQTTEREAVIKRRAQVMEQGFTGLLARTTGFSWLFEKVFSRQEKNIAARHEAAKQAVLAGHAQERKALSAQYRLMRKRASDQPLSKEEKRNRQFAENRHDITVPRWKRMLQEIRENAADITERRFRTKKDDERQHGSKKHKNRSKDKKPRSNRKPAHKQTRRPPNTPKGDNLL